MTPAPDDVIALGRDFLLACVARDADFIVKHSHDTPGEPFLVIGTPPGEHWTVEMMVEHLGPMPPTTFVNLQPTGHVYGDTAWLTAFTDLDLPNGMRLQTRATIILLRSEGEWRVVHIHLSEGVEREL